MGEKIFKTGIFFIIAIFSISCAGTVDNNWSKDGYDLQNTNRTKSKGVQEVSEILWKYKAESIIRTSILLVDEVLYFGDGFGIIYALDAKTGSEHWTFQTYRKPGIIGYSISYTPTIKDGILYVGTNFFWLYAIDIKSGRLLWEFETDGEVSSPIVYDNVVYFGIDDHYFYAVNAMTGLEKWKFESEGSIHSTPVVYDKKVLFRDSNDNIYALDVKSGKVICQVMTGMLEL